MDKFLAMGGYGGYIWTSYAVFFIVLAIDAIAIRLRRRQVIADLRGRVARQRARAVTGGGTQP